MSKGESLSCISKAKYDVIVAKIKGKFKVPVNRRTDDQINALNLFRKRKDFSLGRAGRLLCTGKIVIAEEELPRHVKKTFIESNGCGSRVLWSKLKQRYTGFSEKRITEILHRSSYYHKQYPRFTNKPVPKTVTSSTPNQRWQIDIVSMKGFEVKYQRSAYKYILQVIDIHSRYIMPQPLTSKSSAEVATALEKVMLDNGFPGTIQCDNGLEFQGKAMKSLLEKQDIKIIHGRPYYPQSQGKCERSNQSLRRKILFACRRKKGFNWASDLKHIANSINTSAKRVIGNMTPFQVYHGRNHSGEPKSLSRKEMKRKLAKANKSFRRRQLKGAERPSKYNIGESVLLRYPFTKSRVPTKRHIVNGMIIDAKSGGRYLVQFNNPKYRNKVTVREWVRVDNITSLTLETERQKQRNVNEHLQRSRKDRATKKLHRARYYLVLNHADNIRMLDSEFPNCVNVLMNPEPNGNCQFSAIKHQLQLHGIYRDEPYLRKKSVDHLNRNRLFYEKFVYGSSICDYLKQMSQDGAYGDNLTLIAIMREYNMQCLVVSAAGAEHSTIVSNDGNYDMNLPLITLGYFPENQGMHYVSISVDIKQVLELLEETVFPSPGPESPLTVDSDQTLNTDTEMSLNQDSEPAQSPISDPSSNSEPAHSPRSDPSSNSEPAQSHRSEPSSNSEPAKSHRSDPSSNSEPAQSRRSEPSSNSEPAKSHRSDPSSNSEPAQSRRSEPSSNSEPAQSPISEPSSNSEPAKSRRSEPSSNSEPAQSPISEPSSNSEPAKSHRSDPSSNSEPAQSPISDPSSNSEPAQSRRSEPSSNSEPAQSPRSEPLSKPESELAQSPRSEPAVTVHTLESFRAQRAELIKMRRQTRKTRETHFPFKLLPLLVQEMIVSKTIYQNPATRFVLEKVDRHFVDLIKSMNIPRPRIYVSPALLDNVPNPVSVRYFLRKLGRNSGIIQEIKRTIKEPNWANAWLRLRVSGICWYDIVDIQYSRR